MSNWISVEERLPEEGVLIRVRLCNSIEFRTIRRGDGVLFRDYIMPMAHVTHWQPLPEPPKEGE